MQNVQTKINSTKTSSGKKGRPPALNEEEQMLVRQIIGKYCRDGRSTVSDAYVAERLAMENINVSVETVRRIRLKLNIRACPRGGARPGAGRPRKAENKQKIYRKLTVSNYALVRAAGSVYECSPPIWDEKNGTWTKPEKWQVKKDATGKKMANLPNITFFPGMPFGLGHGKCTHGGGRSDKNEVYKKMK